MTRVLLATGLAGVCAIIAAGVLGFAAGGRYSYNSVGLFTLRQDKFTGEVIGCGFDDGNRICRTVMERKPLPKGSTFARLPDSEGQTEAPR